MAGWRGFAPAMGGPKAIDLARAGIGAGLGLLLAGLALQGLGIGWLIALDQVRVSPETLPSMVCSPIRPLVVPVKVSPLVVIEASTS